jgi:hypothetical protein
MKNLSLVLSAFALVLGSSFAQAEVTAPLWTCNLGFQAEGSGIRFIIGNFELSGPGQISCVDVAGNTEVIPVFVRMGAKPSLSVAIGHLKVVGLATGIGLAASPEELLGGYLVAGVRGALGVGAGAHLALHAADKALTFNATVQAVAGLGASIGMDYVEILDAR